METILEKILVERKKQLEKEKAEQHMPSLKEALKKNELQIIGEFKRASPSKGQIAPEDINMFKQLDSYVDKEIAAFSILTESHFFKGNNNDLIEARKRYPNIPILRKDFIYDEYQVAHAKFMGASAILLIVKMLSEIKLNELHKLVKQLDMEVLVEIHDDEDLNKALQIPQLEILGINNRDLNTFTTSLSTTETLLPKIKNRNDLVIVSESGFHTKKDLELAQKLGVDAVLVGEALMKGML